MMWSVRWEYKDENNRCAREPSLMPRLAMTQQRLWRRRRELWRSYDAGVVTETNDDTVPTVKKGVSERGGCWRRIT